MPQRRVRTVQTVQKLGDSTAQFLSLVTRPLIYNDRCMGRAMLGSTVITCSASARAAYGRIYSIYRREGVHSAPKIDSRLPLHF